MIDLFCGVGGWTIPALAAGVECIGFDIADLGYPGTLHQHALPVSIELLRYMDPNLVVASPPCEQYARYYLPWINGDPPDETLLRWSIGLIKALDCPVIVECSKFAALRVPGASMFGPYALWGDIPVLMPRIPYFKSSMSGAEPHLRSRIHPELSDWIVHALLSNQLHKSR